MPVIDRIRLLNRVRNDLAHRSPVSPSQAQQKLAECQDEVFDILWKLKGMKKVRLIRYNGQVGAIMQHEVFAGHGRFPALEEMTLEPRQRQDIDGYLQEGAMLAVLGENLVCLRPFVSCIEVDEGHARRIYISKKVENQVFQFEDLTTSQFHHHPQADFQTDLNDLRSLFGLAPETP